MPLVECRLSKVVMSEAHERQVIVLEETNGPRKFPISIGFFEVYAIHRFVNGKAPPRPFAHELIGSILNALRAGIGQALSAWELGQHVTDLSSPYYYEQMGLYRLLAELRGRDELGRFCNECLGELVRYDIGHNTELVHTLETFFDQNANASQAARALYVHRNTLNYRLQRIVEITGLDLNDAEARLTLQLALKIHHLS